MLCLPDCQLLKVLYRLSSELIFYQLPSDSEEQVEKAWLSVNENNEYLWTLSNDDRVISDKFVTKWEYIK